MTEIIFESNSVEWDLLPCSSPLRRVLQSAFATWDLQTGPSPAAPLSAACCNLHLQSGICRRARPLGVLWALRCFFRISLTKTAKAGPLHAACAVCNLQSDRRALQLSSGAQAAVCICNLQAADAPALQRTEPTRPLSRRLRQFVKFLLRGHLLRPVLKPIAQAVRRHELSSNVQLHAADRLSSAAGRKPADRMTMRSMMTNVCLSGTIAHSHTRHTPCASPPLPKVPGPTR